MTRQIAMTRPVTAEILTEQPPRSALWPVAANQEPAAEAAETAPRDLLRHDHGGILDKIMLLGQPALGKYLRSVRDQVVDGADLDRGVLADEWCRANDYYQELEESETGIADEIEVLDPGAVGALSDQICET